MNNLVLGKYLPLDSFMHKLDPRAKIISLLLMMAAVFIRASWIGYGIIFFVLLLVVKFSKLQLRFILKALKPMMMMLFFLLIINILVSKQGQLLVKISFIEIYSGAIFDTLYIVVRLILMVMVTTLLTATTKPLDLTMGIESLLKPFGLFGLPYHDIAMMISIALRFIPTIIEETMRIMNAQKSRGVDFEEGKLKEKIYAILSLVVPLFSVAFNRSADLANAMEARSFVPGAKRSRYRILKYKTGDYILIASCLVLIGILIYIRLCVI